MDGPWGINCFLTHQEATMDCLTCQQEMVNVLVQTKDGEIAYDICETCGSLWLDGGELDKMAFQVAGSIEFCSTERAGATARVGAIVVGGAIAVVIVTVAGIAVVLSGRADDRVRSAADVRVVVAQV